MPYRTHHRFSTACIVILAVVVLVACGNNQPISRSQTTTGDAGESVVASAWGLQGDGDETTEPMELPAGTATIQCTYEGEGEFAIDIVDTAGATVQQLRSAGGTACADLAYTLDQPGSYRVRVSADGPWEINVTYDDSDSVTETR